MTPKQKNSKDAFLPALPDYIHKWCGKDGTWPTAGRDGQITVRDKNWMLLVRDGRFHELDHVASFFMRLKTSLVRLRR